MNQTASRQHNSAFLSALNLVEDPICNLSLGTVDRRDVTSMTTNEKDSDQKERNENKTKKTCLGTVLISFLYFDSLRERETTLLYVTKDETETEAKKQQVKERENKKACPRRQDPKSP